MANYYLAPSLVRLRDELNFTHRDRDKSSDGWIGDASHAARKSGHNPDWSAGGVVRATDTDKDGILTADLLHIALHDERTEYVIWNGFIYLRSTGFRKQVYTGSNKHTGHMHIEIRKGKKYEDDKRNWGYADRVLGRLVAPSPAAPTPGRKSVDEIAGEVIAGGWGNNPDRSIRLQQAGYSPTEVQAAVNARLGTTKPVAVRPSIGVIADQVIKMQWGSGNERKARLTAAGYNYTAVQAEVNRRLK